MSFLNLRIEEGALTKDTDRALADSRSWRRPKKGITFACALDGTGRELGRIALDASNADAAAEAAAFIRKHAPPQAEIKLTVQTLEENK